VPERFDRRLVGTAAFRRDEQNPTLGQALFAAVCERGLEGVVAKRERDRTARLSGWVKTKNRATARSAEERNRGRRHRSQLRAY